MSGFKAFVLKGNLIEVAVAFIMAGAFATVITATVDLLMGIVGKFFGQPDVSAWKPAELPVGAWITAIIAFVILAAVVYFVIVVPYTRARDRYFPAEEEPGGPTEIDLLTEIRNSLAVR